MEIILSFFVYAIFASIFLVGIKKDRSLSGEECYKHLNGMRGIMALEIIIGHVVRYEHTYLFPFGKFMLVGVGFFFFVSGWGLCRSFHEKQGYLDSFLQTRFSYLVGVAVIALGVTSLIDIISPIKTDYSFYSLEISDIIKSSFARTNWYIRELLLLYLVFYFIYRYVKKNQLTVLTIGVMIIAYGLYKLGYVRCWYASILSFPLGFFFYEYYPIIMKLLKSRKGFLIIGGFGILGLNSILIDESSFGAAFLTNNSICICVIMILVLLSTVYDVTNPVKSFLNKYATELFLFQFIFLAIAEKAGWNYWYRMVFVIGMDILVSVLVHIPVKMLKCVCGRKKLEK